MYLYALAVEIDVVVKLNVPIINVEIKSRYMYVVFRNSPMREKHDQSALSHPLLLTGADKLVNYTLQNACIFRSLTHVQWKCACVDILRRKNYVDAPT